MKKLLGAGLLWLFPIIMHGQNLSIVDAKTEQPLSRVVVLSENPLRMQTSNVNGQINLDDFKNLERIQFRLMGYKTAVYSYQKLTEMGYRVTLTPDLLALEPVVVSANRWAQARNEVPFKIKAINASEIQLQAPQTAADLLGQSGEVFIQKSQQGGGSPMLRGFATNRLLISVDGVRMNTAIFRSGNLQNIISLDPFAIERTEVLFGPGSVMYGSDALGGVMAFYTLLPEFALNDSIQQHYGAASRFSTANNESAFHFHSKLGWKKWGLVISASHTTFGDLRMGSQGPNEYLRPWYVQRIGQQDQMVSNPNPQVQSPSGYSQDNLLAKLAYKPSRQIELQYAFHYSSTSSYDRYDRLLMTRNGLPRSAEWRYGPQVWNMNHLQLKHFAQSGAYDALNLSLAHQYFEESRIDRNFGGDLQRTRLEKVNAYALNLDLNKAFGNGHNLFYGAEWVFNEVQSSGSDFDLPTNETQIGPSRYPQSDWYSYAVFASWQKNYNESFNVHAGIRYNAFGLNADFSNNLPFYPFPFQTAELNRSALTGSLGFEWQPNENWNLSAHASSGFRSPNVDDLGKIFDSEPGNVVVPNPDLKPEYAYTAEIDISRRFGQAIHLDVVAYYTHLQDALVRRDSYLNGVDSLLYDGEWSDVQSIQNAAFARVYGLEAKLEAAINKQWLFSSTFSYQIGEEELDNGSLAPLRHAAPAFGRIGLRYRNKGITLDFYTLYSFEKGYQNMPPEEIEKPHLYALDAQDRPYSPGWYTLNLKTRMTLNEHVSLTAGVENLSDQRYRPYSSGLSAPGRNFVFGIQWQ